MLVFKAGSCECPGGGAAGVGPGQGHRHKQGGAQEGRGGQRLLHGRQAGPTRLVFDLEYQASRRMLFFGETFIWGSVSERHQIPLARALACTRGIWQECQYSNEASSLVARNAFKSGLKCTASYMIVRCDVDAVSLMLSSSRQDIKTKELLFVIPHGVILDGKVTRQKRAEPVRILLLLHFLE